jgi:hypothetical protein
VDSPDFGGTGTGVRMADQDSTEGLKLLIGAIGAALALAAFFGIHSWTQLKDLGSSTSSSASAAVPAPAPVPATPACLDFLTCGKVYFQQVGAPQFMGACNRDSSGCPVSQVFTNIGTVTGGATATFFLDNQSDTSAPDQAGAVGSCTAIVPAEPTNGSVSAGCTIYTSDTGSLNLYSVVNNPGS